jgi:hypothetical protein
MTSEAAHDDEKYYEQQKRFSFFVQYFSTKARRKMMRSFLDTLQPDQNTSVLDVGVTTNRRSDSNFFERYYPHPEKITALGLDDASFLETEYPGLTFVRADAMAMPFAERSFDIATSWATIEHVGSRERQKQFIAEMCRVSKRVLITTPNRWFPVEFHTVMPLIHWLKPETFRSIIRKFGMHELATEEALNLMGESDFMEMLPPDVRCTKLHSRLFGLVSNLVFFLESDD